MFLFSIEKQEIGFSNMRDITRIRFSSDGLPVVQWTRHGNSQKHREKEGEIKQSFFGVFRPFFVELITVNLS